MPLSGDAFIKELWSYAQEISYEQHPWFDGIINHRWTKEQIILGELQHYLRIRMIPVYVGHIMINASKDNELLSMYRGNLEDELMGPKNHVDLFVQLLEEFGINRKEADSVEPAPGTAAAIEMLVGICSRRSPVEAVAARFLAEAQHSGPNGLAAKVYKAYTEYYRISPKGAETLTSSAIRFASVLLMPRSFSMECSITLEQTEQAIP